MKNWYPRGKLKDNDEGEALIKILTQDKTIVIDFQKEITWIGFDKATALALAQALITHANNINDGNLQ